jgi:hypothetical protein
MEKQDISGGPEITASMGPYLLNEYTISPVHQKQAWKCMHHVACLLL